MQDRFRNPGFALGLLLLAAPACVTSGRSSYAAMRNDYAAIESSSRAENARHETALAAGTLDRAELIRAVLDRNPAIEMSRQSWRAALARYHKAGTHEDPMIEVGAAPLSFASSNAPIGFEVALSQRIPLGAKLEAQAALAVAEAEAADGDYHNARLQLALAASQLYDEYFVAVRSADINAKHVGLVRAMKESAIIAYETGGGSTQDALRAESELSQLEYEAIALETRRKVVVAQLNSLLHRDPRAPLPAPPAELSLPTSTDGQGDEREAKTALEARPDLAAARARANAEGARSWAAEQESYPDLTLSTSYNSMWDMPEHRWMAGVALNIPLERAGRRGAVEEADAMRAAARSDVQRMTDEARSEFEVGTLRVREAEAAVRLHEQRLLPVAHAQVEAAQADFAAARGSIADLVDAERNLRSVELNTQVMRAELSKRLAALTRAQGRIPGLAASEAQP